MHAVHQFLKRNLCHLLQIKRLYTEKCYNTKVPLNHVLDHWTKLFQDEGVSDASSSAELIAAHVLGRKTLYDVCKRNTMLDQDGLATISELCKLRLKRLPVQYILREWDFHDLTLKMESPVFIPRPETEELVEHCIHTLQSCWPTECTSRPIFLELGCGSGAISLALLHYFKELRSVCVDISPAACALTKVNAENVAVQDRISVLNNDFTKPTVLEEIKSLGPFCLLVSNPPYVTVEEMKCLQTEISRYEDPVALNGGIDGLDLVRHILQQAPHLVMPHGHIWLEVGKDQPGVIEDVVARDKNLNLHFIKSEKDMFDKQRFCHLQVPLAK